MNSEKLRDSFAINLYVGLLTLIALAVGAVSIFRFNIEIFDLSFLIFAPITIFASPYLRIQLPRTKIYLSVSEVLVFYIFLVYGTSAAVLVAGVESFYTSIEFRRQGIEISNRTFLFNVTMSIVNIFLTAEAVTLLFDFPGNASANDSIAEFGAMLLCLALTQFLVNWINISVFEILRNKTPFKKSGKFLLDSCFNAFVVYIAAALIAGFAVKAQSQFNIILGAVPDNTQTVLFETR